MAEGLNLHRDMPRTAALVKARQQSLPSEGTFEFLLFVLDSLEARKLIVNAEFYSSILVLGAELGGLEMRIASILTRSRKSNSQKEVKLSSDSTDTADSRLILWEDLYKNYSTLKEDLGDGVQHPSIRISSNKQFGRVLAAENAVSYRGRFAAGNRRR